MTIHHHRTFRRLWSATGLGLLVCLAGTSCPVYPDSPLFGGGGGGGGGGGVNVRLEPGDYLGDAACTQFFQSRGRAPTLDAVDIPVRLTVSEQGELMRDGTLLEEGATSDITLGIFAMERTVTRISSTGDELVINLNASVNVQSDSGALLELGGGGSETYQQNGEDQVLYRFAMQVTTVDPSQEVLDLAYDCSATLERR